MPALPGAEERNGRGVDKRDGLEIGSSAAGLSDGYTAGCRADHAPHNIACSCQALLLASPASGMIGGEPSLRVRGDAKERPRS